MRANKPGIKVTDIYTRIYPVGDGLYIYEYCLWGMGMGYMFLLLFSFIIVKPAIYIVYICNTHVMGVVNIHTVKKFGIHF